MKVNQVVSEHKKGVRAHIYNKKATTKAQGPVPLYGPDKNDAKLKPVKVTEMEWAPPGYGSGKTATNPDGTASSQRQADRAWDALQYQRSQEKKIKPLQPGKPMEEEMPGQTVGKVQQVNPDGTAVIQSPDGKTQTVQQTQLQQGDNNTLSMQVPKIQPGQQVDASKTIEEEPADEAGLVQQYSSQLQSMLPKVSQPWEKAQIEARIKAVTKDGWVPKDPNGKAIAVLPPAQWEAKMDPQTVLKICGVNGPGLSPEFKQKMGGSVSQGIMKYTGFEESADNKLLDKMLTIAGLR